MGKETDPSSNYRIGILEEKDVPPLVSIVKAWVREDGRLAEKECEDIVDRFRRSLKKENGDVYLVTRSLQGRAEGVMGFAEVAPELTPWRTSPESRTAGLAAVFLSPVCRGKGRGHALIAALFAEARKAGWDEMVWTSRRRYRETAWKFYTAAAGEPVGTIDGFFETGIVTPVWKKRLS